MHIVFGTSSVAALSAAFELDSSLQSEVLCFEDDLSVGPLFILDTKDGQLGRQQWWDQVTEVGGSASQVQPESVGTPGAKASGDAENSGLTVSSEGEAGAQGEGDTGAQQGAREAGGQGAGTTASGAGATGTVATPPTPLREGALGVIRQPGNRGSGNTSGAASASSGAGGNTPGAEAAPVVPELPRDVQLFKDLKAALKLDPDLQISIWAGQNARDVSAYYWLVSQLYDFAGRVHIIYLNNLPFLNEKGNIFYPTHLSQILPKEFIKAKKLARPVSLAEFEIDGDEWRRLMNENAGIRLLEGGKKLKGEPNTYYDKELIAAAGKESVKASKVVNQVIGKLKFPITEAFLGWRLKELVKQGVFEGKGEFKSLKDFEVKVPGNETPAND